MKKRIPYRSLLIPVILFLLLITHTDKAVAGVTEGLTQCLQVIIPSLFPFFFITCWLNSKLLGSTIPFLGGIRKLLKLPDGSESLLLMGFLGGYPVGAKTISDAYEKNAVSLETAHILLGYCNNAGPSFIFGICHILFSSSWLPWVIWGLQIVSALITALLLPRPTQTSCTNHAAINLSVSSALQKSIIITATVCGWILLFKVLLAFISPFALFRRSKYVFSGILEISNGCLLLTDLFPLSLRFLFFSAFLSLGGLCVYLQTVSAVSSTGTGLYLTGKCIQCAVCILITIPVSVLIFHELPFSVPAMLAITLSCIIVILILFRKSRK